MSPNRESVPGNQFEVQGARTNTIYQERDIVGYPVSDYELDSLSRFTTLTTVFTSLAVLFLSVGLGGFLTLVDARWLFVVAMVIVGAIFSALGGWAFLTQRTHIDRIRGESRPR